MSSDSKIKNDFLYAIKASGSRNEAGYEKEDFRNALKTYEFCKNNPYLKTAEFEREQMNRSMKKVETSYFPIESKNSSYLKSIAQESSYLQAMPNEKALLEISHSLKSEKGSSVSQCIDLKEASKITSDLCMNSPLWAISQKSCSLTEKKSSLAEISVDQFKEGEGEQLELLAKRLYEKLLSEGKIKVENDRVSFSYKDREIEFEIPQNSIVRKFKPNQR